MTALFASLLLASLPATNSVALERGLDTVSVDEIRADIHYIASDEMAGRDTISEEQRVAARFIKNRLERLGFQPGNGERFLWEYPLAMTALDPDSLAASLDERALTYGADYCFTDSFGTTQLSTEGDLVYCGEGGRDDFGMDLSGSWALCDFSDENIYRLRSRARKAGAVGLVLAAGPEDDTDLMAHFAEADTASEDDAQVSLETAGESATDSTPTLQEELLQHSQAADERQAEDVAAEDAAAASETCGRRGVGGFVKFLTYPQRIVEVVGERRRTWRLANGRIAKKRMEGRRWAWYNGPSVSISCVEPQQAKSEVNTFVKLCVDMGFEASHAQRAFHAQGGNTDKAMEALLS